MIAAASRFTKRHTQENETRSHRDTRPFASAAQHFVSGLFVARCTLEWRAAAAARRVD